MRVSILKVKAFIRLNANKDVVNKLTVLFDKQTKDKAADTSIEFDSGFLLKWIDHNTKHIEYKKALRLKVNVIKPKVLSLEIHTYAPELNTLIFKDGTRNSVPKCTTLDEAVTYLAKTI